MTTFLHSDCPRWMLCGDPNHQRMIDVLSEQSFEYTYGAYGWCYIIVHLTVPAHTLLWHMWKLPLPPILMFITHTRVFGLGNGMVQSGSPHVCVYEMPLLPLLVLWHGIPDLMWQIYTFRIVWMLFVWHYTTYIIYVTVSARRARHNAMHWEFSELSEKPSIHLLDLISDRIYAYAWIC